MNGRWALGDLILCGVIAAIMFFVSDVFIIWAFFLGWWRGKLWERAVDHAHV